MICFVKGEKLFIYMAYLRVGDILYFLSMKVLESKYNSDFHNFFSPVCKECHSREVECFSQY